MQDPGAVRDAIIDYLAVLGADACLDTIHGAVTARLGDTAKSSIRSYLSLNTPRQFERTGRGRYRLQARNDLFSDCGAEAPQPVFVGNFVKLYHVDCFAWLAQQPERSVHAVVTDPPYGLVEYTPKEQEKLRAGRGGIWRMPPSFDGHLRAPLPRFTVLDQQDRADLRAFFKRLAALLQRTTVPGANVVVASNPLLAHIVAGAMVEGGLEMRGYIARLVMTMRGGDRPKNAHEEFSGVSVMPRSMWEPWIVLVSIHEHVESGESVVIPSRMRRFAGALDVDNR